jgi:hypothetical protein
MTLLSELKIKARNAHLVKSELVIVV